MREIEVILFSSVSEDGVGTRREPATMFPRAAIPAGFRLEGGERKFVVLERGGELTLAIGPELEGKYYYHKEIARCAGFRESEVRGGGSLVMSLARGNMYVTFQGSSGDFGVFDYRILSPETRKAIAEALGCQVSFKWQN